jgi:hypothetical protein
MIFWAKAFASELCPSASPAWPSGLRPRWCRDGGAPGGEERQRLGDLGVLRLLNAGGQLRDLDADGVVGRESRHGDGLLVVGDPRWAKVMSAALWVADTVVGLLVAGSAGLVAPAACEQQGGDTAGEHTEHGLVVHRRRIRTCPDIAASSS